jgi:fructosamine-3-kinase
MNKNVLKNIVERLGLHLKKEVTVVNVQRVYGGDINETYVLTTSAGKYFIKTNNHAANDMFEKEFSGLQLLKQANAITVPSPLFFGESNGIYFLIMECIEKGKPTAHFWKQFATGLATLHKQTRERFGLHENNYIGSLKQQNNYCNTWAVFYATQRILPLMQKAFSENKCSKEDLLLTEKLCSKFDALFPKEPPSLLHGDLWSGNCMVNETGMPVVYDPAVYYGFREMYIAMTLLFGGFDQKLYPYYNERFPLEKGWKERIELCQLYPLLVHLLLFGGHYYYSVMEIIKKYAL